MKRFIIFASWLILFLSPNVMANNSQYDTTHLTPLQKYVTQENGTERAFDNEYWDNKQEGIYVDIISGKALFSSKDKYDSGTGWPSFTKPIDAVAITKHNDFSLGSKRVEIKSSESNSHLGHIFTDGPKEHGGSRYCTNSAALKFIPKENLAKEGYEKYLQLFDADNQNKVSNESKYEKAILAGGCFWGMEDLFSKLGGVVNVVSGYSGGNIANPTYELISTGITNHAEAIEVTFDKTQITYEKILKFFFTIHDPTTLDRQQNDIGTQYRSVIFYINPEQKNISFNVINQANRSGVFKKPVVTRITKFNTFYKAEEYHQDYLNKNPNGYTCHRIRNEWEF